MKAVIRTPTKQFGYVETQIEVSTYEELKVEHDSLYGLLNEVGYTDSNFLDDLVIIIKNNLRIEGEEAIEQYEGFSQKQKLVLKEIRNLVERAVSKYKPTK